MSRIGTAVAGALLAAALVVTAVAPAAEPAAEVPSTTAEPGSAVDGTYALPLDGEVVAPFDNPAVPWGAGHRGVDLAGAVGAQVLAAADGVVAFVGVVVDRQVISIDHPDGIRTTYEPVAALVEVGDAVVQGQPIGTLMSETSHCAPQVCLHWGAKIGDDYLDPMSLLGDPVIRLYPMGSGPEGLSAAPPPASAARGSAGSTRAPTQHPASRRRSSSAP